MRSENIKVSVIVPIYKVEAYIEECVHSLMRQTMSDGIEFIFIDDGSPDKSVEILNRTIKSYPSRLDQIIISQQKNNGVTITREVGSKLAKGEYIIYCDSDDWVEIDMYETMYEKAKSENADIVICDFFLNGKTQRYISQKPLQLTASSVLGSISGSNYKVIHGAVWNKMVKASLYKNLQFPYGINYCEDVYMQFQFLRGNKKIAYIPKGFYHYRVTPGSLVNSMPKKRIDECVALIERFNEYHNTTPDTEYRTACEAKIAGLIYYLCFENMKGTRRVEERLLPYYNYISSNKQITKLDRQYIYNFLKGNYWLAYIQAKFARYRMIATNIGKRLLPSRRYNH